MGRLQETIDGVRHVRIYNREDTERETYLGRTHEGLKHSFISGMSSVALGTTCNLIAGYGSTIIYGLAAYYVLEDRMTLGDLLALNSYVWMAIGPALRLTTFAAQFSQTRVSLQRIVEVLTQNPDVASAPNAPPITAPEGCVDFNQIHFSYKPDEPLFQDLSLHIAPSTSVALVGHTGCGKTTLTALLMRMWDVQKGDITIDGANIRDVDLGSLRSLFGVVMQSPVVFEGTVAENIAYGRPNATRAQIEAAGEAAEIGEFVDRLPDGLDTRLGSYGVKLSVGQKQRVSIARAILRNPRILILDEATSSLDSQAEAAIQRAIQRVLKGRTSFVVAHRLSTIVGADVIVVMDKGRIVEQGSHAVLMQLEDGSYRRLYERMRLAARDKS